MGMGIPLPSADPVVIEHVRINDTVVAPDVSCVGVARVERIGTRAALVMYDVRSIGRQSGRMLWEYFPTVRLFMPAAQVVPIGRLLLADQPVIATDGGRIQFFA